MTRAHKRSRRHHRQKIETLKTIVATKLPNFAVMCQSPAADRVLLVQDAFGLQDICILGAAIKLAGHFGKIVEILPRPADRTV